MRSILAFLLAACFAMAAVPGAAQPYATSEHLQSGAAARIRVLSSRNSLVTGGDALVEIEAPGQIAITLNGQPIDGAFRQTGQAGVRMGLVTGLRLGDNLLAVARAGAAPARLTLTNWPLQGPVISGPKETPFICMTDRFELPATGGTLGPALNADCEVATRVDYVYRRRQGGFRPLPTGQVPADLAEIVDRAGGRHAYIVRIETGVVNRAVYQIAMLHDPRGPAPTPFTPSRIWNRGLVFMFGGGCPGGMYQQGGTTGGVLDDQVLGRGYAMASSSLNVFGNNCDDLLASETMMMVKERFIERYGPVAHTIGFGCSGGSYQAWQIADNYPGLLDGVVAGCSFPEVGNAAVKTHAFGARLLYGYYRERASVPWTEEQITAVSGLPTFSSFRSEGERQDRIDPKTCPSVLPKDLTYDAKDRPAGARCSIYDHGRNVYGRDPTTGFARRPLDNVGVQYGLLAFRAGIISKAQFIDVNRRIGGVDIDAKFTEARTEGDVQAIRQAYRSGRVLSGGGGLAVTPLVDYRAYTDLERGDQHHRFHSLSIRDRLAAANGRTDNLAMLTEGPKYGLFTLNSPVLARGFDGMGVWLNAIQADRSARPMAQKIAIARPATLGDACFTDDGGRIAEPQTANPASACAKLYPVNGDPYIQAGGPLANNILKCALKPLNPADYPTPFTPEEWSEMQVAFPTGVCDYTRPGIGQERLAGVWLSFGPAGAPGSPRR